MKLTQFCTNTVLIISIFSSTALTHADEDKRRNNAGPPQEAFDACLDKTEGDTCEVITPKDETLVGTCRIHPRITQTLCVPDNHKRPDKQ